MNPGAYYYSHGHRTNCCVGLQGWEGKGGLNARGFSDGNWDEVAEPANASEQRFESENTPAFFFNPISITSVVYYRQEHRSVSLY